MSAETIPCSLDVCAAAFVEAMKVRRFSKSTLASYQGSLAVFFGHLHSTGIDDVREVSRQTIADYQLWLAGKPYTDWTRVARLQAVRRFFEHLEKTDVLLVNPCAGMLLPKIEKRLPRNVLTPEEARALLNAPNTQTKIGIRDKAILEMFYSTGIRLEEMTGLTVHDVDHRNGFVRVNKGKFAKDRVVPLGRKACDYVREYLDKVRLEWVKAASKTGHEQAVDERALWLSSMRPHGSLKSQLIEVMVKHYARRAGLEKKVTPHVWRHSCATHLVADGANVVYVQRLLGHRSLRTTQIYARVAVPELKQTHSRAHPANDRQAGPAPNVAAPLPVASRDDKNKLALYRRQAKPAPNGADAPEESK
jgi:integrase/recombinase XerD